MPTDCTAEFYIRTMNSRQFLIWATTIKSMESNSEKKKIMKTVNKGLKESRKVALATAAPAVRKAVKKIDKSVRQRASPKMTHLRRWAQALSRPFENPGCICPVSYNPAPSITTTTARMTVTNLSVNVNPNQTLQYVIFPGHGAPLANVQSVLGSASAVGMNMDSVSYHARGDYTPVAGSGLSPGTKTCVGPVGYTMAAQEYKPFCMTTSVLGNGGATNVGPSYPSFFDVPLPYTSVAGDQAHLRWQLVSCGFRIFNVTPSITRGGNVTTVQFVNQAGVAQAGGGGATTQAQLEFNPSFRVHGDAGDGVELSWIPRTQDLAYWHNSNSIAGDGTNFSADSLAGAGFAMFLNNPTGSSQQYVVQVVFNFMLSGNLVQAVSSEAVVESSLKSPIEQTIVHLQNNTSTAAPAPAYAEASRMGDTGQTMNEKISGLKDSVYRFAQDTFHSVSRGVTEGTIRAASHHFGGSYGHDRYGQALAPRLT